MISAADLDAAFLTDDFAEEAVFTVGTDEITVSGYFTAASDAVDQYGVQIEAVEPSLTVQSAAIPGVTRGTAVTVSGGTYQVVRIQQVGTGVSVCYLKAT